VRGQALGGLLGPVFLFSPLALVALRDPVGRRLLAAALLFGLPYAANIGTRFLIPPLPYVALAMAIVLGRWPRLLALLVLAHAVSAWPEVMVRYCDPYAWRLDRIWWKQALRLENEHEFLTRKWPLYGAARLLEDLTPPGSRILASNQTGEAYTSREVLVSFQSAEGEVLRDILHTPVYPDFQPRKRVRLRFPEQTLRKVRVRQTAHAAPDHWSVAEMRVLRRGVELPRDSRWRLRAHPNPWDVQAAFDNSAATRWQTWDKAAPGMFLEIDFQREETADELVLEMSQDQHRVRLECDGDSGGGAWRTLSAQPVEHVGAPAIGLRGQAAAIVKERGIGYLLIHENDHWAEDMARRSEDWRIVMLGERWGFRLYRIR
jgi:hypothetical protein